MCIIFACHEKLPPEDDLRAGAWRNDDGAGIAWLAGNGKVRWVKGLKSDHEEVVKYIEKNKIKFPLAIHFRNASVGGNSLLLTHPFPVTRGVELLNEGEANKILMHNGHVVDWDKHFMHCLYSSPEVQCPDGLWSDSRVLAFLVASKGEGILNFVGGRSGRVLLFQGVPYANRKKNALDRFFRLWGDWVNMDTVAKDGYYQSIILDSWVRNQSSGKGTGTTVHSGGATTSPHSTNSGNRKQGEKLLTASSRHGRGRTAGNDDDEDDDVSNWPRNSWTLDELEEICKELEKEQDHARRLVGG